MTRRTCVAIALVVAVVAGCTVAGCTGEQSQPAGSQKQPTDTERSSTAPEASRPSTPLTTPSPDSSTSSAPKERSRFDVFAAMEDVRFLADRIGPRLATGPAFRRGARLVQRRFTELGYATERQAFPVPAGDSWGVPVAAGRSSNVIASSKEFEWAQPYRIVGAHLDTVAVSPGAEDNASGIAALLELARLAAIGRTGTPVVFIAFGGEEPRGTGDDMHHFGSRHYVAEMSQPQRRLLRAMVSLDRVGVGASVPVCTGPLSPPDVQDRILAVARREAIASHRCELTTSDHWSFEKAGFTVARLGSTPYPEYHSDADLPPVVNPRQLARTGRLAWAWLGTSATG